MLTVTAPDKMASLASKMLHVRGAGRGHLGVDRKFWLNRRRFVVGKCCRTLVKTRRSACRHLSVNHEKCDWLPINRLIGVADKGEVPVR